MLIFEIMAVYYYYFIIILLAITLISILIALFKYFKNRPFKNFIKKHPASFYVAIILSFLTILFLIISFILYVGIEHFQSELYYYD